jgi:predicted dehydrogenase
VSLRVAVIGVGHLGRHHARILSSLPGVQLAAVVDTNRARAEEIARTVNAEALYDARLLTGVVSGFPPPPKATAGLAEAPSGREGGSRTVDAVTIAVPTEKHREIAMPFLSAGIPVLVEKPMAKSLAEADELIAAAAKANVALAVGHTERFNPAVEAARALLVDPRFIEVHRLGTFPDRSLDIDVVFDLMIHDLDVVLSLVKADVESIEAVGVPVLTGRVDIANVRLRFANGCIANLTASRISRDRVRKIRFFQPAAYLSVDYAAQKIELWRLVKGAGPMPSIEGGEVPVTNEEPLKRELADFVDAVVSKRTPLVDGHQGRRALALAQRITDKMLTELSPRRHEDTKTQRL